MTNDQVIAIFRDCGALLDGHFVYASGRHGRHFLQAARVLQYPEHTEPLCRALAAPFADSAIELVVGPATGGIVLAYETARHVPGSRGIFSEKQADGAFAVGRGFRVPKGARTLVVEDIITTGGSVQKTVDHLLERGADVVGVSALIDRSGGSASFACRYEPLARFQLESFPPDAVPADLAAIPVVEPDDLLA